MTHRISRLASWVLAASALLIAPPAARADGSHHPKPCSNRTLQGTFGFYRTGTVDEGTGGLAAVGWLSFDGNGNGSVLQSISRNGDYSYDVTGDFTYQLDGDCTGKGFIDGDEFVRIVVTHDGGTLYMLSESTGNAVHGVGTKIHND
ncbi:MAG TPA: hypothetical protein VMN82_09645 [Thermoanaerobaculia bacterium]|nr:hypothetical protein [Thermoanaerobaculia bacterium]